MEIATNPSEPSQLTQEGGLKPPKREYEYMVILDGNTKYFYDLDSALEFVKTKFTKTSFCNIRPYYYENVVTEMGFCFFGRIGRETKSARDLEN